jgi:hypothetical protein
MKVALLLTGFPRTYTRTYENLKKNILDVHDVDTYICSWDKCQLKSGDPFISIDTESVIRKYSGKLASYAFIDHERFISNRFSNINLIDRPNDVFKVDPRAMQHGSYWIERLRDQWYIVKYAFSMLHNPSQYDLIMRLRFDVDLLKIDLHQKEFVMPKDIGGWQYSDHFAYGNYESMQKYCNVFDSFHDMYLTHNTDISHAVNLLKFYMEDYKVPVKTYIDDSINYTIIK